MLSVDPSQKQRLSPEVLHLLQAGGVWCTIFDARADRTATVGRYYKCWYQQTEQGTGLVIVFHPQAEALEAETTGWATGDQPLIVWWNGAAEGAIEAPGDAQKIKVTARVDRIGCVNGDLYKFMGDDPSVLLFHKGGTVRILRTEPRQDGKGPFTLTFSNPPNSRVPPPEIPVLDAEFRPVQRSEPSPSS